MEHISNYNNIIYDQISINLEMILLHVSYHRTTNQN